MAELTPQNDPASTLASGISAGASSLTVATGDGTGKGFSDPAGTNVGRLVLVRASDQKKEIVSFTDRSGDSFTGLTRAVEPIRGDQTAYAFVTGDAVYEVLTNASLAALLAINQPALGTTAAAATAANTGGSASTASKSDHAHGHDDHANLGSVSANQHHNQAHDHTTGDSSGVLTNDEHDGYGEYAEIASPSTPGANKLRLYAKDSGGVSTLYYKKDDGTEVELGAAGALSSHDHTAGAGDGGVLTNDTHDGYSEYTEIAAPSSPAANKGRLYGKDSGGVTLPFWKDEGGTEYDLSSSATGAPTNYPYLGFGSNGSLSAEVDILGFQLTNEIKGWPPVVADNSDLDALKLWWRKVGTPTIAPTVVDVSGAGLTVTYKRAIKVQANAASDGLKQTWTYANEPRLKSGRVISALLAIWSVSSVSVTAKLVNSDASQTAAAAVSAAAWTIVEIPAHTLAGTSCDLQVTAGAAGTFYVVPLGVCIGTRGLALGPRPQSYVDVGSGSIVSNVDPGAAWTTGSAAATTSPLATRLVFVVDYLNSTNTTSTLAVRRKGSSANEGDVARIVRSSSTASYTPGTGEVSLDDAGDFEFIGSATAGNAESVYIHQKGWWEWA